MQPCVRLLLFSIEIDISVIFPEYFLYHFLTIPLKKIVLHYFAKLHCIVLKPKPYSRLHGCFGLPPGLFFELYFLSHRVLSSLYSRYLHALVYSTVIIDFLTDEHGILAFIVPTK